MRPLGADLLRTWCVTPLGYPEHPELPGVGGNFAEGLRWTKDEGHFTFSIISFLLTSCFGYLGILNCGLGSLKGFQNAVVANAVYPTLKEEKQWDWY